MTCLVEWSRLTGEFANSYRRLKVAADSTQV
jgi:hypothetical protein